MMPSTGSSANGGSFAVAGIWPAQIEARARHVFSRGVFRPRQELPFYCNPIALFITVWILMLACLSVHVSYVIYPGLATPFLIFIVSAGSLLLGFFACTAVLDRDAQKDASTSFLLDLTSLRRLNLLFCVLASLLMAINWLLSGPPPAISDPSTYLTYGKLKQVLFPLLTCIAVNSILDTSRLRRFLFIAFALCGLGLYVARGILLIAFLQMFFLFSLRSRVSRKKQLWLALGALAIAIAGMTIIGNLRTAHDIFIDFLQIRGEYSDWPMAFFGPSPMFRSLFPISVGSWPMARLTANRSHSSIHCFPSFMAPSDPYADVYGSMNMVDGASTYLQAWALDFSYLGIYFANLLIGIGCGWLARPRLSKKRSHPRHLPHVHIFALFRQHVLPALNRASSILSGFRSKALLSLAATQGS